MPPPDEPSGTQHAPYAAPHVLPGLRLRYTLAAALLSAAAFAGGGAIALPLYHDSLVAGVDRAGSDTAHAVAAGVRGGKVPDPIPMPVAAGVPRIQVLDAAGHVISGDPSSAADPPFTAALPASGPDERVASVTGSPYLPEHRAALVAVRTAGAKGSDTVVVAQSLDAADARAGQAIELSAVLGACAVATVAAAAWFAVGRTLHRIERLRTQVLAVTASGDLTRRVPHSGTDELARLGVTLNDMLAALARASERQRRFVADAAHELRTPIAGLNASIEVAARHPHLARDPAWIGELGDAHRRLGRLVDDLLVLAGLDERAPRRRAVVDLAGVVADAARRRTPPGVRIVLSPLEPTPVLGDATQLERIVANLIDNALRHARREVRVVLATDAGSALVTVADDGSGVPESERERIWDRFARLDDARCRDGDRGGTGLGLALVKELAEAHAGSVGLTDAHEGGAAFHIRLPLSDICGLLDEAQSAGEGRNP